MDSRSLRAVFFSGRASPARGVTLGGEMGFQLGENLTKNGLIFELFGEICTLILTKAAKCDSYFLGSHEAGKIEDSETFEAPFPAPAIKVGRNPAEIRIRVPEGRAAMSQTTKRALGASLIRLLQQKPIDKITVSQLAAECGINRMTFYYHFKDIYDLVEWSFAQEVKRVLEGKLTYDTWQEGFLQIFRLAEENRLVVLNVYRGAGRDQIIRYLGPFVRQLVRHMVEELSRGMAVKEENKQFIAQFYEHAFVGVVLSWVEDGMRENPADIVERTSILIRGSVSRALEAFRTDRVLARTEPAI